jgi:hypothetical protein
LLARLERSFRRRSRGRRVRSFRSGRARGTRGRCRHRSPEQTRVTDALRNSNASCSRDGSTAPPSIGGLRQGAVQITLAERVTRSQNSAVRTAFFKSQLSEARLVQCKRRRAAPLVHIAARPRSGGEEEARERSCEVTNAGSDPHAQCEDVLTSSGDPSNSDGCAVVAGSPPAGQRSGDP